MVSGSELRVPSVSLPQPVTRNELPLHSLRSLRLSLSPSTSHPDYTTWFNKCKGQSAESAQKVKKLDRRREVERVRTTNERHPFKLNVLRVLRAACLCTILSQMSSGLMVDSMTTAELPGANGKPKRHLWRWIIGIPVAAALLFIAIVRPTSPNSPGEMVHAIVAFLTAGLFISLLLSKRRRLLVRLFLSASGLYYTTGAIVFVVKGDPWFSTGKLMPPESPVLGVIGIAYGAGLILLAVFIKKPVNLSWKFRKSESKQQDEE